MARSLGAAQRDNLDTFHRALKNAMLRADLLFARDDPNLLDRGIPRAASPPLAALLLLLAKVVLVGRQMDDGPVKRPPYPTHLAS